MTSSIFCSGPPGPPDGLFSRAALAQCQQATANTASLSESFRIAQNPPLIFAYPTRGISSCHEPPGQTSAQRQPLAMAPVLAVRDKMSIGFRESDYAQQTYHVNDWSDSRRSAERVAGEGPLWSPVRELPMLLPVGPYDLPDMPMQGAGFIKTRSRSSNCGVLIDKNFLVITQNPPPISAYLVEGIANPQGPRPPRTGRASCPDRKVEPGR